MSDIIIQYAGHFRKPRECLSFGAQDTRIILVEGGKQTVLFTGARFDPEEFQKQMAEISRTSVVTVP